MICKTQFLYYSYYYVQFSQCHYHLDNKPLSILTQMSARLNGPLFPKFLRAKVFCIFWPRYLHVFFGLQIQPREPQAGDKTCLFGYVTPLIFCYLYFRITCLFVECRSLSLSLFCIFLSICRSSVCLCMP